MHIFNDGFGGVNAIYPEMVHTVMSHGAQVGTGWHGKEEDRSTFTWELNPAIMNISNPRRRLACGRDQNVAFLLAEILWIMRGKRDVKPLEFYNSNIASFSDDGEIFNAAYGYRLRHWEAKDGVHDQIEDVVKALRNDHNTRQATLVISDPQFDSAFDLDGFPNVTKDRACNIVSHLLIREGKLNWLQIIRSNDVIWGTPTNWMQWTSLQEWLARRLNVQVGKFTMISDSLHLYEKHAPEAEMLRDGDLYSMFNWDHAYFTATEAELHKLGDLEAAIRIGTPPEMIWTSDLPECWRPILMIFLAHRYYKEKQDQLCIDTLSHAFGHDPVYATAALRFYWGKRWRKDGGLFAPKIEIEVGKLAADWITG